MSRILILIKHYKFNDLTDNCIDSMLKSNLLGADIEVIDSTPDNDYRHTYINTYHKVDNRVSLIESYNLFFKPIYDLYVYASNDIIVHKNWLLGIVKSIENNDRLGVLAPMYDQVGGGVLEYFPPPNLVPGSEEWGVWLDNNLPEPGTYIKTKHVDNVVFCFTHKLYEQVGLPDGNFPGAGWGANLDYCYRARRAGFFVAASLGSFIHHAHRGTYGKIDPDYAKKAESQRDEYLRKKYGDPSIVW